MQEKNKHINYYSAEDIQRYINKQMTPAEMHAFERASLEDPFLAEALEGYTATPVASIPADRNELKERLNEKASPKKTIPLYRKMGWSVAAAILIIFGAAATWLWLKPPAEKSIAQKKENTAKAAQQEEKAPADTALPDSIASITQSSEANTPSQPVITKQPQSNSSKSAAPTAPELKPTPKPAEKEALTQDKAENSGKVAVQSKDLQANENNAAVKRAVEQSPATFESREITGRTEQASAKKNTAPAIALNIFKGRITNEQHKPLPFVNLNISGTATYTYTDANGNFTLLSGDSQMVVHVKSVGFESVDFTLHADRASNNISLKAAENELTAVAVDRPDKRKQMKVNDDLEKAGNEEPDAEPADGWGNYDIYLLNNERLSRQGNNKLTGSVELSFIVNQYGHLTEFSILKSTCPACEKEATRLIKEGPKWKLLKGNTPAKVEATLHF